MDFDYPWLLIALPLLFALGWMTSRLDVRQLRRDGREAPKAYFKGLTLLLNEQPDKAIDSFIEAVQHDPDTTELHFGLGNLFRRRGDVERAVRVHQHLLDRGDLSSADRQRAQHALAQDFMHAGLFDRAEQAYGELRGTAFDKDAQLALLSLHERARDWPAATAIARGLELRGAGSFASRIAHHECETAVEADAARDSERADAAIERAKQADPTAMRPWLLAGQRHAHAGRHEQALAQWDELLVKQPLAWPLLAHDYAGSARGSGRIDRARALLARAYAAHADIDLLQALGELDPQGTAQDQRVLDHLQRQNDLVSAQQVLALPLERWDRATQTRLHDVVAAAARPLQRYRCAACGFEARQYFWQCPGCQSWDSFPPRRGGAA